MKCGQSWRHQDTRRFTLLSRGECMGAAMYDSNPDLSRPWTLPSGTWVQIGRTHRTHHLRWFCGLFHCRKCRYNGQENKKIRKLVDPCFDQETNHQTIRKLKRLEEGILPQSVQYWPRPSNVPENAHCGLLHPIGLQREIGDECGGTQDPGTTPPPTPTPPAAHDANRDKDDNDDNDHRHFIDDTSTTT